MTDELPPPDFTLDGGDSHCYYAATVRAAIAAAVARERYKWELLIDQVTIDAMEQDVLSEWWGPMQAAIRKGG